jgi:predicted GH43/DUF377 family glycosyl hydrolase
MTLATETRRPVIKRHGAPILKPRDDVPWASEMILNPAIIRQEGGRRIHMLFRSSGPGKPFCGHPAPFPIYLGYAWSGDEGISWNVDWSRPALAPALEENLEGLIQEVSGRREWNYANGCIEDPRLFQIGRDVYLSAACRIFPPGAYWITDDPLQCAPKWALEGGSSHGRAIRENLTVTVLFQVELSALTDGDYKNAFRYLGPLTDPERSDNRDAFLFPEKLTIRGESLYVLIHRPKTPELYDRRYTKPTVFISCAKELRELATAPVLEEPLAAPLFAWEANRVGGSSPPIRIDHTRWLLPVHGKQDAAVGYTQSFLILEENPNGLPVLKNRCATRLFYAEQEWERQGKFTTPCVFTCGALRSGDDLLMTYGAADTVCGTATVNFDELVQHVEMFGPTGEPLGRFDNLTTP